MTSEIFPHTEHALSGLVTSHQRTHRVPGVLGAIAHEGKPQWHKGIGAANRAKPGRPHDLDTHLMVASNTKTFTAAMIMQLRDEGRLSLRDGVDEHLPGTVHERVTIGQLLSHSSGMQREPVGDVWDTLDFPDRTELVSGWNEAERILPGGAHYHYSNLGFAVLGEIVARLDQREWAESLQQRLLNPLELKRTGLAGGARQAGRYYVPPYTDVPHDEPLVDKRATSAAGALWSTATDIATWHGFLIDPDEEVLAPATVEEMCVPHSLEQTPDWTSAYGLGLQLMRDDGRIWVGHSGSLPGSATAFFSHRASGTTSVACMNSTTPGSPTRLALNLGSTFLELQPPRPKPWTPGATVPPELAPLLGVWFSEGSRYTFSVRQGRLEARAQGAGSDAPPSVFEPLEPEVFRTVSGRERGERLVVRRRADGAVRQMNWATYRFTREPLAFGEPVD